MLEIKSFNRMSDIWNRIFGFFTFTDFPISRLFRQLQGINDFYNDGSDQGNKF